MRLTFAERENIISACVYNLYCWFESHMKFTCANDGNWFRVQNEDTQNKGN